MEKTPLKNACNIKKKDDKVDFIKSITTFQYQKANNMNLDAKKVARNFKHDTLNKIITDLYYIYEQKNSKSNSKTNNSDIKEIENEQSQKVQEDNKEEIGKENQENIDQDINKDNENDNKIANENNIEKIINEEDVIKEDEENDNKNEINEESTITDSDNDNDNDNEKKEDDEKIQNEINEPPEIINNEEIKLSQIEKLTLDEKVNEINDQSDTEISILSSDIADLLEPPEIEYDENDFSLSTCLSLFTSTSELLESDGNGYLCQCCCKSDSKTRRDAKIRTLLSELPQTLVIHLKVYFNNILEISTNFKRIIKKK